MSTYRSTVTPEVGLFQQSPRVPLECGALIAEPAISRWPDLLAGDKQRNAEPRRRSAREELLILAARHTEAMDESAAVTEGPWPNFQVDSTRPLIVTGHQPDIYHAGVWVKNFIVDAVCRRTGVAGLNLTVDSDLPSSGAVEVPVEIAEGWGRRAVVLGGIRLGRPWEVQPPLDKTGWEALLHTVREVLPPHWRPVFDAFSDCVRTAPTVSRARSLADSLARARRAWEARCGRPAYLELAVSAMCETRSFYVFVGEVLGRLEEFWSTHNECLREYRVRRRIRSTANPVPELRRDGNLWETPFWCIHPTGERGGLFLLRDASKWKVASKDATFGELADADRDTWPDSLRAMLVEAGAHVRPRALALTMFIRTDIADLFVHGVGGARYERVGDAIARRFFGREAPPYAVCSGTFCVTGGVLGAGEESLLGGNGADDDEALCALRTRLREMRYNPQRFVKSGNEPTLVARKFALIQAIQGATGEEKKRLSGGILRVNSELRASLSDVEEQLRRRLTSAEAAARQRRVMQWRGYPYFLFDPHDLRETVRAYLDL